MDDRLDQLLNSLNRHRVALGGLVVASALGSMAGGFLKPDGLLEEPMAAQLISSTTQTAALEPEMVVTQFPTNTSNRPWVAGTDALNADTLPRLPAAYDDLAYSEPMAIPDSTPSVADHAVDAVDVAPMIGEPAA